MNASLRFVPLLCVILATTSAATELPAPRTHLVVMRDGARLATDVYLPSEEAEDLPCLLVRTPYDRRRYGREFGSMARWGYAVAIQDTRGRFGSEGKPMAFQDDGWGERRDGYDTVRWLSEQPFSNGRVGTLGASAMGIVQYLLAPTRPPGLVCQYILVAAPSLYHHSAYPGGVFRESLVVRWLEAHAHPDALRRTLAHPRYDEHWKGYDMLRVAGRVEVPAVHRGGWYDCFQQGTLDAFAVLQARGGKGARGRQKLVMGPWTHGGPGRRELGDFELLPGARRAPVDLSARRWFDHHLKGEENGIDDLPPVVYYVMGPFDGAPSSGNVWRTAEGWPPPAETTAFYLGPDGELSREPPPKGGTLGFDHDPRRPVPTVGGANLNLPAGPRDQREIERRDDVIVFTSKPLPEDLEVTGRLLATIHLSTGARDTDIVLRLTDVYPDGRSILIAEGARRLSALFPGEDLSKRKEPLEVEVDLWSTSLVFAAGHRLRLSIAGSSFPRYAVNPGTGLPAHRSPGFAVQRNTVHVGAKHPSRVVLPIVGAEPGKEEG